MADSEQIDRPAEAPAPRRQSPQPDRQDGGEAEHDRRRAAALPWVRILMVLVLIGLIVGGVLWWWSTKDLLSTDDAYTDGRAIAIAPHVNGYVVSLDVNDNQFVHAGDPLLHIDPRDYQAALEQAQGQLAAAQGQMAAAQKGFEVAQTTFPARLLEAQAQLASSQAALFKAQTDNKRQRSLPKAATTQQDVDYATAALRSAEAQVAQSEAQLQQAMPVKPNIAQTGAQVKQINGQVLQAEAAMRQAQLNLDWCVVRAPQDGWVTKRNVEQGNYAQQGVQILSLVSPQVWITANFKEDQLDRMRPGQNVRISVDAYPGLKLEGHVDSVQLGSGSKFTAFPPENATGNFVKIVQRVPVKIDIDRGLDPNLPLPLGISVTPTVSLK